MPLVGLQNTWTVRKSSLSYKHLSKMNLIIVPFLNHELLIAKLDAYGFGNHFCKFIFDYLKNRKQRTKVRDAFSKWLKTKLGVPQGSILGPLLFNLFINDMFFFIEKTDIANYADDNTQYATDTHLDDLLKLLETETSIVLNWFKINEMKANDSKCHLIVPNHRDVSVTLGEKHIIAEDSHYKPA